MLEIKKFFFYKSFGLTIKSEIQLPELVQLKVEDNIYDIKVAVSDLSPALPLVDKGGFSVVKTTVLFQIPDTAIFCIKDGSEIIVSPIKGSEIDKIRLYILGTCMGVLLLQRKTLTLHGSAIAIGDKAYAFIGESGAGKSTLASAFIRKGYRLLSDDVIPVSLSDGEIPMAIPSYPQQKLWQESLDFLGLDNSNYKPLFEREKKFAIPVHSSFSDIPIPLSGVFEIVKKDNEKVAFSEVYGLERLRMIYIHTYRSSLIPRLGLTDWHFNESAKVVKKIKMYQIQRPSSGFSAPEILHLILKTIEKENRQYA